MRAGGSARGRQPLAPRLLLLAALLLAVAGMAPSLQPGPWRWSWLGHNGARYSHIARNYLRDGLVDRAAPRLDTARPAGAGPGEPEVYAHHPPGLELLLAGVFALAGVGETPARLLAAAGTLLALGLLFDLVKRAADARAAGFAVLLAAAFPMTGIYGAHVDVQGPLVLAASLLVVRAYARWLDGRGRAATLVALAALASALDWYGLYAPGLCALHAAWAHRRLRAAALLALLTLGLFGAWFAWLVTLPGHSLGEMGRAAGVRGPALLLTQGETAREYLAAWWTQSRRLLPGWPAWLLLVGGVLAGCGRPTRLESAAGERASPGGPEGTTGAPRGLGPAGLVAVLAGMPVIHGLLFPAGMLVHGYWLFGLPVAFGAAGGLACRRLHAAVPLLLAAALVLAGWLSPVPPLPDEPDEVPALLGGMLAAHTGPGQAVLTNYDCNPLQPGADGDEHLFLRPAVTFYADRPVRGRVRDAADLAEARRRRPDARWFLLVPWPEPSPELLAALAGQTGGERLLHAEPPVRLLELR